MTDFKLDPFNPECIVAWRARDETYSKIADIKTLPVAGNEIQFKFPDIRPKPSLPTGTAYLLAPRRLNETDEEWASRCVRIVNIGDPNESSHE